MEIEVGAILTGKVKGITKFGAFVEIAPGKDGLVYISEIANTFVKEVSDHLSVGQEVTVKVIGIDDSGRINLSIKQALEPVKVPEHSNYTDELFGEGSERGLDQEFEDKLKRFMKASDSKMSDIRRQSEKRSSRRRGR